MPRRLIGMVLILAGVCGGTAADAASITWYASIDEASAAARKANKPMLLDFWASWCASCRAMDADVFSDESVASAASNVLTVRIDIDRRGSIARRYRVDGVPTLLLTDSYGNELFRVAGALTRTAMAQLLREFPHDIAEINRWSRILAEDGDNTRAMVAMGHVLKAASLYRASNQYFGRAMRSRKGAASTRAEVFTAMGWNSLALKEANDAIRMFEHALDGGQEEPGAAEPMLGLAQALWVKGDRTKAKQVLERLILRFSTGEASDAARRLLAAWTALGAR